MTYKWCDLMRCANASCSSAAFQMDCFERESARNQILFHLLDHVDGLDTDQRQIVLCQQIKWACENINKHCRASYTINHKAICRHHSSAM